MSIPAHTLTNTPSAAAPPLSRPAASSRRDGTARVCRVHLVPLARGRCLPAVRMTLPDTGGEEDRIAATCAGVVCAIRAADAVALRVDVDAGDDSGRRDAAASTRLHETIARKFDACGISVQAGDGAEPSPDSPAGLVRDAGDVTPTRPTAPTTPAPAALTAPAPAPAAPPKVLDVAAALDAVDRALEVLCGTRGPHRECDGAAARHPSDGSAQARVAPARVDPRVLQTACRVSDLPLLLEQVLRGQPRRLDALTAALVIWIMDRPALRDIALLQWSGDRSTGEIALRAQLRWEQGDEYPLELGERIWGEGIPPDLRRIGRALALVSQCAELAPARRQAGALAASAWLSWVQGRRDHAERYACRACDREPEHGLGEIVRSFIMVGHAPHWAVPVATAPTSGAR